MIRLPTLSTLTDTLFPYPPLFRSPNGGEHPTPVVSGHRDLRDTACPGANTYKTLPYLRAQSRIGAHVVALHETFMRAQPPPEQYRRWLAVADRDGRRAAATGMARARSEERRGGREGGE